MKTKGDDHDGARFESTCFDKRAIRAHRNREAAARSRQMKREYIAHLENTVLQLPQTVDELRKENWYWLSLDTTWAAELLREEWFVESLQVGNEESL